MYLLLFAVMMNLHFQVPLFCWPKFFLPTQGNICFWFAAKLCVMWFMARKGFQQNWKISMCTKCWQRCSDEPLSFAMHIRSSWHFSIWLRSPFYFNFIIVYISYVFFFHLFLWFLSYNVSNYISVCRSNSVVFYISNSVFLWTLSANMTIQKTGTVNCFLLRKLHSY